MGVPGADDVMLAYQSSSFHDALYLREVLGVRPAPEFESWLLARGIFETPRRAALQANTLRALPDFVRQLTSSESATKDH
jgi:ethanolamine ammonia-lyase large subunit